MKVTIIGSGYVGLVTGACLAEVGNDVMCLDLDESKIALLKQGRVPTHEPGLVKMVSNCAASGQLRFTTDVAAAVEHGQLQMIAVGTPAGEDGSADISHVLAAARSIGRHMNDYRIVINKSTVPVGTADRVRNAIADELKRRGVTTEFSVVSNPEFLKEGTAIADFMRPDRIVIGSSDERALQAMCQLYAPFNRNHDRILTMAVRSAELAKYAANAMLATRISFMNELAILADATGADLTGRRFALWGLAFKPNTDDMREAPSLEIVRGLIARHATVVAYDPIAMDNAKKVFGVCPGLSYAATPLAAVNGSDALIVATEWREFKSPNFATLKSSLKVPAIFDGRNLYDPHYVASFGLEYHAIGRPDPGMKKASP